MPSNSPRKPKHQGKCVSAILRRGDVLYLPSRSWHWAAAHRKASCHLEIGLIPLSGADLSMALGARNMLSDMGSPTMAAPLPLWHYSKAEYAVDDVLPVCFDLPWADAPMDISTACNPGSVRMALQRLSGSSGRTLPSNYRPLSGPVPSPPMRPWPRNRDRGFFSPVMEALQPVAQIGGLMAILLMLLCFCSAMNSEESRETRRQGRSARQIHQERTMMRKNRIHLQQQTRRVKLD